MAKELNLQHLAGQVMALGTAISALISTHPDGAAFEAAYSELDLVMQQDVLLSRQALQGDDGMRVGYSETRRLLLASIPKA